MTGEAVSDAHDVISVAASMCRAFEGFRSRPYLCPAGIPTIGYGSTHYTNGKKVALSDAPITVQQAEELLRWELQGCVNAILSYSPVLASHTNKLAAVADFVYNLGVGRYRASTLRVRINQCNWPAAKTELLKWNKGGGKILPGLVKRRLVEALMF